ncbi:ATP-binding protein [Piscibacillus salipiscarius]|uniref:ATP-binding protein n=1 Tax=Piscibacillus salipiscarius TaxID=299480 RepID=UPI0034E2AD58
MKKKFFKRFYRLNQHEKKINSTGLGLAIAKEIISNHKGNIGVYSSKQENTFWFTLPKRKTMST